MPRNYVRTTTRQSWTIEAMEAALKALANHEMGYKKATNQFGVPKTLKRRHKDGNKFSKGSSTSLGRYYSFFFLSRDTEAELVWYVLTMEQMMFGVTTSDIRLLAYQLAAQNHLQLPLKNETAGRY